MIRAENIFKSFGEQQVLKGINCTFHDGQTNLIIGRSGAGKTVLLKILVGLFTQDSGNIWYDDVNFSQLDKNQTKAIRQKVGMLFQGSALFDSLSVEQNVRFPLDMFSNMTKLEKDNRVNYCLERVGLQGSNLKYPNSIVVQQHDIHCEKSSRIIAYSWIEIILADRLCEHIIELIHAQQPIKIRQDKLVGLVSVFHMRKETLKNLKSSKSAHAIVECVFGCSGIVNGRAFVIQVI